MNELLKTLLDQSEEGVLKNVQIMMHGQITPGDVRETDYEGVYQMTVMIASPDGSRTGTTDLYFTADAVFGLMLPPEMSLIARPVVQG